jgi:hypothetical protein
MVTDFRSVLIVMRLSMVIPDRARMPAEFFSAAV